MTTALAVVLNVGGMAMQKALPEADQINYLPRVTQPVLMLNGTYDMFFPVETAPETDVPSTRNFPGRQEDARLRIRTPRAFERIHQGDTGLV